MLYTSVCPSFIDSLGVFENLYFVDIRFLLVYCAFHVYCYVFHLFLISFHRSNLQRHSMYMKIIFVTLAIINI